MAQMPNKNLEQLIHSRQVLNVYDHILSSLIDVATQKINDPDYIPTQGLYNLLGLIASEENNKQAIVDVEMICQYKFDFISIRKVIDILKSEEHINYEALRVNLKKMREILRKSEEDTGNRQQSQMQLKSHGIYS